MPLRFISIPIRNLRQRRLRTVFTVIGVAVAVGGFVVLSGLGNGVERAWVTSLRGPGFHLLGTRKGSLDILSGSLDQSLAVEMRAVAGVGDVSAELVDLVTLENGDAVMVRGWEPDSVLWRSGTIVAGRMPTPDAAGEVMLGESLAATLGRRPGDDVLPFGARLRVAGVARLAGVLNNHSLVMPLAEMQRLLARPGKVTAFNVRVARADDDGEIAAVRDRLNGRFPQVAFAEAETVAQHNEMFRLWRGMAWATSLVGLGMGLVIVVNTMLVAVLERTREIGVLVAVGWSRRRVLSLVVLEGLALAVAGGVLGLALGSLGLGLLSDHPKLRGFVAVSPSAGAAVRCLAAAAALGVAGAVYPAWRAVRLNPVEALRDQ